jgi:hypothetical protein
MRRTRFMSLVFLVLSVAFFFVSDFRQGLMSAPTMYGIMNGHLWMAGEIEIPQGKLDEMIQAARQKRDARTLAFAAMHGNEGAEERMKLAAEATALDPQLTWIYSKVYAVVSYGDKGSPEVKQAVAKLEAWDPDNAVPYLYEGEQILTGPKGIGGGLPKLDALMNEAEWRSAMEKAYAAPRYDTYTDREFEFDRSWLTEHHMAKPVRIILMVASYHIPNLLNIRTYSQLLNQKLGKDAENAGRLPEALGYYWTSAHMGERMRMGSRTLIEKLIGVALEKDAYEHLLPALRKTGQTDQAATLQFALDNTHQTLESSFGGEDLLEHSMNYGWQALLVDVFDLAVWIFGLLTLLSVVYVNAKRWVRPEKKGQLYQLMTVAENYLPILLFISCAGLFLAYYPFAQNYHYFMTAKGSIHNLEPIMYNIFPSSDVIPGNNGIAIGNPFRPYMWFALAGLAVAALLQIPGRKRT